MGMWIELGIFGLVLLFGFWQLYDVGQERRKREAATKQPPSAPSGDSGQTPG